MRRDRGGTAQGGVTTAPSRSTSIAGRFPSAGEDVEPLLAPAGDVVEVVHSPACGAEGVAQGGLPPVREVAGKTELGGGPGVSVALLNGEARTPSSPTARRARVSRSPSSDRSRWSRTASAMIPSQGPRGHLSARRGTGRRARPHASARTAGVASLRVTRSPRASRCRASHPGPLPSSRTSPAPTMRRRTCRGSAPSPRPRRRTVLEVALYHRLVASEGAAPCNNEGDGEQR